MELHEILETGLYVNDLEKAREFYGGVLGLKEYSYVKGRKLFYQLDKSMLLLFDPAITIDQEVNVGQAVIPPHGASGPGHMAFTISVERVELTVEHLSRHGVEIESRVKWQNGAESIYVRDPAGNCIEFATSNLWFD